MLDRSFTPNNIPSLGYDLTLKADTDWRGSSFRVLIILQTVSTEDLKAQELVSTDHLKHCINYAKGHARLYEPIKNPSFAVCNFNDRKHLNLQGHARAEAESHFKARVVKLIAHLNPTHILFSGDASLVFHIANAPQKNGWVHEIDGRKVTSTLDFSRLLEKQGASANLLGFWCRHLAYLLIGRLPHSLAHLKPRASYVDTLAKFDKVMALFDKAKVAAVDTETKNLSVLRNAIYTIQFAFDSDKERGFFIPIDHPHLDNPFTEEERAYIKKELRKRLGAKEGPELVTQYGIFDLRVIRRALDLDIIYLPVWEIMAGEHLIDENISSLSNFGVSSGGLAQIFCSYGNDSYISGTMGFSKGDRGNIGIVSPEDKDFQYYCFPKGTLVSTEEGTKAIDDLVAGDSVLSYNHTLEKVEMKRVVATLKHTKRKRMVRLVIDGATFTMTEDHPVWSVDRQAYVAACLVSPGERLMLTS